MRVICKTFNLKIFLESVLACFSQLLIYFRGAYKNILLKLLSSLLYYATFGLSVYVEV